MRQGLVLLGVIQLVLGVFLAVAPGQFVDTIAPYGDAEHHFLRDISTFYLAMGAVLLLAVERVSWRVPVLVLVTLQYAIHSINHLIDIGGTDPGWLGPFNFLSLLFLTFVSGYLLSAAARGAR
jgi:hypothetical protein